MGKALGTVFHWRGECITPRGEENTGAFLLAEASKDQVQNPAFPKLKIHAALLAQACSFRCMSVPLKLLWHRNG